jgi:uncharacterized protein YmfQ (DUF2313 family)
MAFSSDEYRQMLLRLLPQGKAWSKSPDSLIYKLMHAFADELNRVDIRSDDLKREIDTRYTLELLSDHEYDLGLPDECQSLANTISKRRSNVHVKYINEGGLNEQSYIDFAEDLGFTIAITEFTPAWTGIAASGDPCGDQTVLFYVQISITLSPGDWTYFTCGSSQCGDYLIEVADTTTLQCILNKHKPAHVHFLFVYTGYGFSAGFSRGFNAIPSDDPAYLSGGFGRGFHVGFNVYYGGGGFSHDGFSDGFYKPI